MYFDGNALVALLADPALTAQLTGSRRFASPLSVLEAVSASPEAGLDGVTALLEAAGIELRDMPPAHRLIEAAGAAPLAALHAACAAYYEAEPWTAA
jgi:hypothetical protein